MGSLFSKSSDSKNENTKSKGNNNERQVTSKDKAMLDLKVSRDKLKRYQKKVSDPNYYYGFLTLSIFGYLLQLEIESQKLLEQAKILISQGKKVIEIKHVYLFKGEYFSCYSIFIFLDQDRALLMLKLKKHKEQEVSNIDGQLLNVFQMV